MSVLMSYLQPLIRVSIFLILTFNTGSAMAEWKFFVEPGGVYGARDTPLHIYLNCRDTEKGCLTFLVSRTPCSKGEIANLTVTAPGSVYKGRFLCDSWRMPPESPTYGLGMYRSFDKTSPIMLFMLNERLFPVDLHFEFRLPNGTIESWEYSSWDYLEALLRVFKMHDQLYR